MLAIKSTFDTTPPPCTNCEHVERCRHAPLACQDYFNYTNAMTSRIMEATRKGTLKTGREPCRAYFDRVFRLCDVEVFRQGMVQECGRQMRADSFGIYHCVRHG